MHAMVMVETMRQADAPNIRESIVNTVRQNEGLPLPLHFAAYTLAMVEAAEGDLTLGCLNSALFESLFQKHLAALGMSDAHLERMPEPAITLSDDSIPMPIRVTETDGQIVAEIALMAIAGGADYVNGMPAMLTLRRRDVDGDLSMDYVQWVPCETPAQAVNSRNLCTVCKTNFVDPDAGIDTCDACLRYV